GTDDTDIGLMRNQPVNIGSLQLIFRDSFMHHILQHLNRELEYRTTIHVDIGIAAYDAATDTARNRQDITIIAAGMQVTRQNAGLVALGKHHRTRTITKEYT